MSSPKISRVFKDVILQNQAAAFEMAISAGQDGTAKRPNGVKVVQHLPLGSGALTILYFTFSSLLVPLTEDVKKPIV